MQGQAYRFPFQLYQQWKQHLDRYGFVVIANWISKDQCRKYVGQFWSIMEVLADGKLDRNDVQTQVLSKNYPPVLHGGMIQYVGHSNVQWELRKRAKPIFQKLWKTDKLSCSFDGFCFMNGIRNYKKVSIDSFLHSDQAPIKNRLWSYQGIQALTDSGPQEGGFVVAPQSHIHHYQYFKEKGLQKNKKDWFLVPQQDKGKTPLICIKVNNQAGDFILWDSRTFHCNTVPKQKVLRVCSYICMIPKELIQQKTLKQRREAAENKRVSNHHPGDGFRIFPRLPRYLQNQKRFEQLLKVVNSCEHVKEYMELI